MPSTVAAPPSRMDSTRGKKVGENSSIFPTSSITVIGVAVADSREGSAMLSKEGTSTEYLPTMYLPLPTVASVPIADCSADAEGFRATTSKPERSLPERRSAV